MTLTWALALILSYGLRFWGGQHPEPFTIRPVLIYGLLFGPSIILGAWLLLIGLQKRDI